MPKKFVLPLIFTILLFLLACSISYEGVNFSGDEEANMLSTGTAIAELVQGLGTPDPEDAGVIINRVTEEPVPTPVAAKPQPSSPAVSEPEPSTVSVTEYSATSTNFNCICQDSGNVTTEFKFVGDQLELDGQLYDKTGNNTYKRSWMGYYILVSGEGDQKTETKVDEEKSVVIILTDTGYVLEHYSGDSGSACCYYTFTKIK